MKYLLFIVFLFASLNAFASVDTQGITFWGGQVGTSNYGGNSTITVSHGPTGRYSQVVFNYAPASGIIQGLGYGITPATLTPITMTADEGVDLYFGSLGQEFSMATIASGSVSLLVAVNNTYGYTGLGTAYALPSSGTNPYSGFLYPSNGTFYLGVSSGGGFNATIPRTIFGWAEFSYNPNGIQLISSAVTYDQAGIFIGTMNTAPAPIPLPTAAWLFVSGLLGLIGIASKRKVA